MSGVCIRNIFISNFRSIQRLDCRTDQITALVGNNDSGKSNVLRALNLFFNEETNRKEKLNFEKDYNFNSNPNQRAKEIIIRIELILPKNYIETNGDIIIWERRWRSDGLHYDEYKGDRLSTSTRGNEKREDVEISPKSNVHSLLSKIRYEYIPAVRDSSYFDEMRARIYQTISEVTVRSFTRSSEDFQKSINQHLEDLIESIDDRLGLDTSFHLPTDLSPLFQKLDFRSENEKISLESRGDGIKVRHIPLMLGFIAAQISSMQVQGSMPYTFIWAYEEPENNLEIKSAIALSEEFIELARDSGYQIFLSTHSPVFYNMVHRLHAENGPASLYFVTREQEGNTKVVDDRSNLDAEMGTMLLFAPHVARFESEIRDLQSAVEQAEKAAENALPKLVLEGASDQIFFRRLISAFFPRDRDRIHYVTKPSGAGTNYVVDMVSAFASFRRHDDEKPRAIGLIDWDEAGRKARAAWQELEIQPHLGKLTRLPKPPHLRPAHMRGYRIPITLETLYDAAAWQYAEGRGWSEDRNLTLEASLIPNINELITSNVSIQDQINEEWSIYLLKQMRSERKFQFARYWASQTDTVIEERFGFCQEWLEEVIDYLVGID